LQASHGKLRERPEKSGRRQASLRRLADLPRGRQFVIQDAVEQVGAEVQEGTGPCYGEGRPLIACDRGVHQERQLDRRHLRPDVSPLFANAKVYVK
jgi:hypothetical protein